MKKAAWILFVSIVALGFANSPGKSQEELISEYIEEKIAASEIKSWNLCKENTIKDAVAYVDSIIAVQSSFAISDSVKTPNKPSKPVRPFDTLRLDSTPIIPIVNKPTSDEKDTIE